MKRNGKHKSMAQIYKRGSTWTARITKRVNHELVQTSKGGFKTKVEARLWATEQESQMMKGLDVLDDPSFADFFEAWYHTFKEQSVAESTKKRYLTHAKIIREYFKATKLKKINRPAYQEFLNWYGESHAPSTVQKLDTMIRDCVASAVADGIITINFTAKVKVVGDESRSFHVEYLNLDEIKKLVRYCYDNRDRRYASSYMVITAIYTGMRLGELSALQWSDIDYGNQTISITKSWNQDRRQMSKPKTESSIRCIPVNGLVIDLFKELEANKPEVETDFVFGSPFTDYPPTSQAVNQFLRRALSQCNMPKQDFHFHSLRHSHVAYLLSNGVDIYAISQRLGHANIGITLKVYAYLLDDYQKKENNKIINSLDNLL